MGLRGIKAAISELSPRQLRALSEWLVAYGVRARGERGGRELINERVADEVTYRLERVRRGKDNCRCEQGQEHGPYWYAYWSEGVKTKSRYVGKRPPLGIPRRRRATTDKSPE